MRSARILGVVAVGLLHVPLATALSPNLNFPNVCSVDSVLRYFTCSRNVSPVCAVELAEQAVEFCRDFLAIKPVTVTVTLATVTPVDSSTVIKTSTTSTTTTIETTTTELTTTLTTETSTLVTSTKTFVNPPDTQQQKRKKKKRSAKATCPSIVSKQLLQRHPASRLSRACSCLSVTPTTSTITIPTATAPTTTVLATSVTIETLIFSSTKVLTATSVKTLVSSTTTTTTAVATFTLPPQCVNPPLSGIFSAGAGNQFQSSVTVSSVQECCAVCYGTLNCVGAGYSSESNGGSCFLLLKVQPQEGTGSSDQCPLGFDSTSTLSNPLPGAVEGALRGPCKPA